MESNVLVSVRGKVITLVTAFKVGVDVLASVVKPQ